jgi:hypothetical protein
MSVKVFISSEIFVIFFRQTFYSVDRNLMISISIVPAKDHPGIVSLLLANLLRRICRLNVFLIVPIFKFLQQPLVRGR